MTEWIDLRGLNCPEPVMVLHGHFREMASGTKVKVVATDPTTEHDIPKFCNNLGHALLSLNATSKLPEGLPTGEKLDDRQRYYCFEIEKC